MLAGLFFGPGVAIYFSMKIGSGINRIILALGSVCALFCLVLSWQLWTKGQETGTLLDQSLAPALALGKAREATGQAIFWGREYSITGEEHQLRKARLAALPTDSLKTSTPARDEWLRSLALTAEAVRSHMELKSELGFLSDQFREKVRIFLAAETRWQTYENTMPGVTPHTRQKRNDRITTVCQVVLLVNESLVQPADSDSPRIPSLLHPMDTLASLPQMIDKGKLADVRAALGDLETLSNQWPQSSFNLRKANDRLAVTSNTWMTQAESQVDEYLSHVQKAGLQWTHKSRVAAIWFLGGAGLVLLFSVLAIISTKRVFGAPLNSVTKDLEKDLNNIEPVGMRLAQASNAIGLDGECLNNELKDISLAMGELTESLVHQGRVANISAEALSGIGTDAASATSSLGQLNSSINGLHDNSEKLDTVVKAINEIAAQASRLAGTAGAADVNAVAKEIKALASQCSDAASKTSKLAEDSRSQTATGLASASQTAKILHHIDEIVSQTAPQTKAMVASAGSSHQKSVRLQNDVGNTWKTAYRNLASARTAAASTGPLLTHLAELKQISDKLDQLDFKSPST